jgi:hypothetical protein
VISNTIFGENHLEEIRQDVQNIDKIPHDFRDRRRHQYSQHHKVPESYVIIKTAIASKTEITTRVR